MEKEGKRSGNCTSKAFLTEAGGTACAVTEGVIAIRCIKESAIQFIEKDTVLPMPFGGE